MSVRSLIAGSLCAVLFVGSIAPAAIAQEKPEAPEARVEVRVVSMPDYFFGPVSKALGIADKLTRVTDPKKAQFVTTLNEREMLLLMSCLQNDPNTTVTVAPRFQGKSKQTLHVEAMEKRFFVTGIDMLRTTEPVVWNPRVEPISVGCKMAVTTTIPESVSHALSVHLKMELDTLEDEHVKPMPLLVPIRKPGAEGQPLRPSDFGIAAWIQQPKLCSLTLDEKIRVKDGETAVLAGWSHTKVTHTDDGPDILREIPFIGSSFKHDHTTKETEHVIVLVTPRRVKASSDAVETSAVGQPTPVVKP